MLRLAVCALAAHAVSAYLVGTGIGDVTGPAAEVNLMGYAAFNQTAAGVHTRLFSRAYVVVGDRAVCRAPCAPRYCVLMYSVALSCVCKLGVISVCPWEGLGASGRPPHPSFKQDSLCSPLGVPSSVYSLFFCFCFCFCFSEVSGVRGAQPP
jgi:hypothetical protein